MHQTNNPNSQYASHTIGNGWAKDVAAGTADSAGAALRISTSMWWSNIDGAAFEAATCDPVQGECVREGRGGAACLCMPFLYELLLLHEKASSQLVRL